MGRKCPEYPIFDRSLFNPEKLDLLIPRRCIVAHNFLRLCRYNVKSQRRYFQLPVIIASHRACELWP
jgi:hypothetical protein